MRRAVRSAIGSTLPALLLVLATSCAGMQKALDAGGEHATEGAGAVAGGTALWLVHPVGWVGAGLAALGGWLGSLFFRPHAAAAAQQGSGGFPWGALVLGALCYMLVRAWRHYPEMFRRALSLAKVSARGFLGGIDKKVEEKPAELPPEATEVK